MNADEPTRGVITRRFRLDELDSAAAAADRKVPAPRPAFGGWLAAKPPDADLHRQVLRALLLDTRVPLTVDARVRDGIVTLSGLVASEWERGHARSSTSCVSGVLGITDHLSVLPRSGTGGQSIGKAVEAALARTAIADLGELTVDTPSTGTVALSGAVTSRSDHDLAVATAWSVTEVEAVHDCIQVEHRPVPRRAGAVPRALTRYPEESHAS
jgi:osmotically-inducible protein OsmY